MTWLRVFLRLLVPCIAALVWVRCIPRATRLAIGRVVLWFTLGPGQSMMVMHDEDQDEWIGDLEYECWLIGVGIHP